jgi:hypothetical protein
MTFFERIRLISLSWDDLHCEMVYVAEGISRVSKGVEGEIQYSLSKTNPLRMRAVLAHLDAGRLEIATMSEETDTLVVRYGPLMARWRAEQLAHPMGSAAEPLQTLPLPDGELQILRALRRNAHKTVRQEDLTAQTGIVRRTLVEYLAHLRSLDFVTRPRGAHGGETLTETGKHYLDLHDPK